MVPETDINFLSELNCQNICELLGSSNIMLDMQAFNRKECVSIEKERWPQMFIPSVAERLDPSHPGLGSLKRS